MGIRIRVFSPGMARFASLVILFGCILPQVTYLGHWPIPGVTSVTAEEHEQQDATGISGENDEGSVDHELHCHTGPSKCGGPQATVGSVWVGEDSGLIGLDSTPRAEAGDSATLKLEPPISRIPHPPQSPA